MTKDQSGQQNNVVPFPVTAEIAARACWRKLETS